MYTVPIQPGISTHSATQRLRRSVLMTPGSDLSLIDKAQQQLADVVWLDLEDGVAAGDKGSARSNVRSTLGGTWMCRELLVRINPLRSGGVEDLETVLDVPDADLPDGIVLPQVDTASDITALDVEITRILVGRDAARPAIWSMVETARALAHIMSIASASANLTALIFGGGALRPLLGLSPVTSATGADPLVHARFQSLVAARAHTLSLIDGAFGSGRDEDGTEASAREGFENGCDGKLVSSPRQIDAVHRAWLPTAEELREARSTLDQLRQLTDNSTAVARLNGQTVMVDIAHDRATSVIARSEVASAPRVGRRRTA